MMPLFDVAEVKNTDNMKKCVQFKTDLELKSVIDFVKIPALDSDYALKLIKCFYQVFYVRYFKTS